MPALSSLPIVAVLDHVEAPPDVVSSLAAAEAVVLSLVEALSVMPDPRAARGVRHTALAVLLIGACAVLAGARSFVAVAEYAHDAGRAVLDVLGVGTTVPHESTIRRVLQRGRRASVGGRVAGLDAGPARRAAPKPGIPLRNQRRVLALDDKTVRGARTRSTGSPDGAVAAPHLVSVIDQATVAVLGQVQVDQKSGER